MCLLNKCFYYYYIKKIYVFKNSTLDHTLVYEPILY